MSGRHKPLVASLIAAFSAFVTLATIASITGIRVNTSYSLPLGLYVRTNDLTASLIEFCPAEPYATESALRNYRTHSVICNDGAAPLLKPIIAQRGDVVTVTSRGIEVNGQVIANTRPVPFDASGRPLQAWPKGEYLVGEGTLWVASTYNAGSYDSRYMGPIRITQIRGRLRPLWLLHG
ncbi:conjugative transfer signal peptidase TraF [Bryobacter aggregatus]|uniref:conjugative transfer signal peptidase TraF n=1 Tax=Bryobacter aggregatus TaxID=360054 RepID=UPI00068C5BA8|nr:conjugative transfer signal peptidase TraF [Bryobacter aggregatus]